MSSVTAFAGLPPQDSSSRLDTLLRLRTYALTIGVFTSVAAPLAVLGRARAEQVAAYAHWAFGLGEGLALIAVLSMGARRRPLTVAVHTALTLGWIYLVSRDCALWATLWKASGLPAVAAML